MLSDFTFITHEFPEKQNIKIYPVADPHFGAREHMEKEWNEFCEMILKDENAYLVLGGDLISNATKSSVSSVFEDVLRPRDQKTKMTEMLYPLKDRILCATTGNHEYRSMRDCDNDPMYDIMCKLDIEDRYRENIAFLRLRFGDRKQSKGHRDPTYVFAITHGAGGGMLTGGSVNRAERFGYVLDGIDGLILGHTHKPFITQPAKIKVDAHTNTISVVPFKVISMTSWLAYGGYAARKMLNPTSHAPQVIYLSGSKKEIKVSM